MFAFVVHVTFHLYAPRFQFKIAVSILNAASIYGYTVYTQYKLTLYGSKVPNSSLTLASSFSFSSRMELSPVDNIHCPTNNPHLIMHKEASAWLQTCLLFSLRVLEACVLFLLLSPWAAVDCSHSEIWSVIVSCQLCGTSTSGSHPVDCNKNYRWHLVEWVQLNHGIKDFKAEININS